MHKFSAFPVHKIPKPIDVHTIRTIMHKVFVYGTLKRNEPNHCLLQDSNNGIGCFVAEGYTKTKYPLIIATKYNIPFILHCPGKGHFVQGEIYDVDDKMLSKLDILEDHPNYYIREIDDIVIKDTLSQCPQEEKCWVYFLKNFKPELLKRPYMDNYSSNGSHGLQYMESKPTKDLIYKAMDTLLNKKKNEN
ncbi:putative gamma-glutamylcyclotransferase CG2811 isoform X2 [Spodoptera litura]|uniref:Gamma-glutamylcyclotransferase family protein n=1 Tax=Spodoptera litura TaxID=69820 RepID=A0A9J7DV88_SPOLT|nr:putative gamma-glutamylcyclotransferase CG2811 isoform X2 [Spodoptera litura]